MRRTLPIVLVLLVGLLGAGAAWLWDTSHAPPAATTGGATSRPAPLVAADAAVTTLPGLNAPAAEPSLPGLVDAHPRPGTVTEVAGPFDDRFDWVAPRISDGVVRGEVDVTSDVSDLLELQVVAVFYDGHGHLLGSSRFVHHGEHAGGEVGHRPDETWPFRIAAPTRFAARAVAAAVGVPVLVNE